MDKARITFDLSEPDRPLKLHIDLPVEAVAPVLVDLGVEVAGAAVIDEEPDDELEDAIKLAIRAGCRNHGEIHAMVGLEVPLSRLEEVMRSMRARGVLLYDASNASRGLGGWSVADG